MKRGSEKMRFEEIVFIILPFVVQLVLCSVTKSRFICLLPILFILLLLLICILGIIITPPGWERLGYVFLAYYNFFVLVICGIACGSWRLIKGRIK